jgi:Tfp pilus assembly protein PilV
MNDPTEPDAEGGFATIEVIVAFVILSIGLMVALEALALASRSVGAADRLRSERLDLKRSALSRQPGPAEPDAGFRP